MSGTDSLERRKRNVPQATGKSITPQPRDLLWFAKLAEHGPLPSSFLLEYCKHTHKSAKRGQERLTDLFNENNTPDNGAYLSRPPQQFRTLDSRYNCLVYDLTKASKKALAASGRDLPLTNTHPGPWTHTLMVSCITASIELACMDRADVNFIPGSQILKRAEADLRCKVTITDAAAGSTFAKDLIPDAVFGLEYLTGDQKSYRFFALEADRATEPATTVNFNRKSFLRSLLQYQFYVEGGAYRDHLKLTAPLLVLHVTSDETRLSKMIDVTAKRFPAGNSYMLFQHLADFGTVFKPPGEPNLGLLERAWKRAGMKRIKIGELD